jgi:cold-inducible RNA-binding protein
VKIDRLLAARREIMSTRIYVGNLAFGTTEMDMQAMFSQHGSVHHVQLIIDKVSGDFRGFGFVTMNDEDGAERAIQALNGTVLNGRSLKVVGNLRRAKRSRAPNSGRATEGDQMRDDSARRQQCLASSANARLRIGRLQAHLANMTGQMRRCMISLCGATQDEAANVLHRVFKLRSRMAATYRQINNLKYQDRARN